MNPFEWWYQIYAWWMTTIYQPDNCHNNKTRLDRIEKALR